MAAPHLRHPKAATGAQSNVGMSATSVTILAANANRLGATIRNDTNSRLYLRLATGSATTSEPERLESQETFIVPADYVGIIVGIWFPAIVVGGSARVNERTP